MPSSSLLPPDNHERDLSGTEVILRFLDSIGRRSDAEFYLALFREAKHRFACLSVDAPVLGHALDATTFDLRFLASLSLYPVVVLGLLDAGSAQAQAMALQHSLQRAHTLARVVRPDYFARPEAFFAAVINATHEQQIPIVPLPHQDHDTPARFAALRGLILALHSRRVIFMLRRGGLRHHGKAVPLVNLHRDYVSLMQSPQLSEKQRLVLGEARTLLLEHASHKCTVSMASPLELLRELFTVKGAGTLLRRGAHITAHDDFAGIDRERLRHLLESAFGRRIKGDFFARPVCRTYLDEDYRGAALVEQTPLGTYLSKFAVEREAQGEGIGGDLWDRVTTEHPLLFWRSRRGNPIDAWYVRQCDGLMRGATWNVFWKGFAPDSIARAVAFAHAQPADFEG